MVDRVIVKFLTGQIKAILLAVGLDLALESVELMGVVEVVLWV